MVEKEDVPQPGLFKSIWLKITGAAASVGGADQITASAAQAQTLGLSPAFWERLFYVIAAAIAVWIIYEVIYHFYDRWKSRILTTSLVNANANTPGAVMVVPKEELAQYEKDGYVIVRRG